MLELFLAALAIIFALLAVFFYKRAKELEERTGELLFEKKSMSAKYGKLTEQFIPFTNDFPFDPQGFRFIGSPIDGIAFEENKIVFCEFKTATAGLSEKQKRIRETVKQKKIEWFEYDLK